jgi:hypothetical protein
MSGRPYIPELIGLLQALKKNELYDELATVQKNEMLQQYLQVTTEDCSLFHRAEAWDSRIFKLHVGKIEHVEGEDPTQIFECLKKFFDQKLYQYTVIRVSQHYIDWIQSLEKNGAVLLDTTVDMVLDVKKIPSIKTSATTVKTADQVEKSKILECAYAFNQGRFFTDPEVQHGAEIYTEWIENSLLKKAADETLVYVDETGKVHGLVTLKKDTLGPLSVLKVPLVVKHPSSEQSGIAQTLLTAAVKMAQEQNIDVMTISTQGANIAAQRAYLNVGFRPYNTGVTMRKLSS